MYICNKKLYALRVPLIFILVFLNNYTHDTHGHPRHLPVELWHKIASFLPGNDPALRWVLTFLVLTDAQADCWVKKYHRDTLGKNPLTFFGPHTALEQAWLRFKQRRKATKQALITNDRDYIQRYLETEYATLLDTCIQATPQQLENFKKDIHYALICLKKYYYMAKNQTTKTVSLETLSILQRLIGLLSFTICGFTFIATIIEHATNTNIVKNLHYLQCLNSTTATNEKHILCKHYAGQFTACYNYIPFISVTVTLLLLNTALLLYIRSISLKQQVAQDIQDLIISYYNQLTAHKKCIIDLTATVSH